MLRLWKLPVLALLLGTTLAAASWWPSMATPNRQVAEQATAHLYLPLIQRQAAVSATPTATPAPPVITAGVLQVTNGVSAADTTACYNDLPEATATAAQISAVCPNPGTYATFISGQSKVLVGNHNPKKQGMWGGTQGNFIAPKNIVTANYVKIDTSVTGYFTQTGIFPVTGEYSVIKMVADLPHSSVLAASENAIDPLSLTQQVDFANAMKAIREQTGLSPFGEMDASILFMDKRGTTARVLEGCTTQESSVWVATGPAYMVQTVLGLRVLYDGYFSDMAVALCMGENTAAWLADIMTNTYFANQVNSFRGRNASQFNWSTVAVPSYETTIGWGGTAALGKLMYDVWMATGERQLIKQGIFLIIPKDLLKYSCQTINGQVECTISAGPGL